MCYPHIEAKQYLRHINEQLVVYNLTGANLNKHYIVDINNVKLFLHFSVDCDIRVQLCC